MTGRRAIALSVTAAMACALASVGLISCAPAASEPPATDARPKRIVSLDYCADQYVLKLVERDRIVALSPDATAHFSYMRDAAQGLPQVRPLAENALVLEPDLVVRSFGGGPNAAALFERAGVPVLQVGWAGDVPAIRDAMIQMGDGLNARDAAKEAVAEIDTRLSALRAPDRPVSALYMTPSGVTTGAGSLIDALMTDAGLTNYETRPGWRSVPLESLTRSQPDLVAAAFFEDPTRGVDRWSTMRHPVARAQLSERPKVNLHSAWVSCGAWFALDALDAMNTAAQGLASSGADLGQPAQHEPARTEPARNKPR